MNLLNRSGLAAIAAATALLSTPALAQDATPVTADPAPIVADTPLPSEPANPPAANSDPLAPAASTTTTTTTTKRTTHITRPTRATAAPSRPVHAPTTIVRTTAPAAATPPAAAVAAPVIEAPADPAMVAPIPAQPLAAPVPAPTSNMLGDDMLPIAGAAGLGILALAGAGFALRRRRRDEDEVVTEEWHEPAMSRPADASIMAPAPVAATAPIVATPAAASAFNWGTSPREAAPAPAINRIEAAKRGPTPDNPSLSLKKRLARAAFFDQRDRAVAAGKAAPMSPMAGLPKAMTSTAQQPARRPEPAMRMTFNRSFQPA